MSQGRFLFVPDTVPPKCLFLHETKGPENRKNEVKSRPPLCLPLKHSTTESMQFGGALSYTQEASLGTNCLHDHWEMAKNEQHKHLNRFRASLPLSPVLNYSCNFSCVLALLGSLLGPFWLSVLQARSCHQATAICVEFPLNHEHALFERGKVVAERGGNGSENFSALSGPF